MKNERLLVVRLLAVFLGLAALNMLFPLIIAFVFKEYDMIRAFSLSMGPVLVFALPAAVLVKKQPVKIRASNGFLLIFLGWILLCLYGAAPYYLSARIPRVCDAVYESVSGFTSTGASVIEHIEDMPLSLIFWRAMTHWLGGMGIIILAAALLPLLGIGGFRFLRAETPGPEKNSKITPRITGRAKRLWFIYIILTVLQFVLLIAGGMNWFDAAVHAFSTMATGGFSSRNNSIAAFRSPYIEWICTVFMLLAGFNFTLIWRFLRGKGMDIVHNSEAKAYALIVLVSTGIITLSLYIRGAAVSGAGGVMRHAFFHTASIISTTGFFVSDHGLWPPLAQGALFLLMFIGGCSGSPAGGVKVIRQVVLWKQMRNEMKKLLCPGGVFSIWLNGKAGKKDVVYSVAGFIFIYFALVLAASLLLSAAGLDLFSSFNGALLSLGNIGMGFGFFGPGKAVNGLPDFVKWGLCFIMVAGRLELWTALVFFSRDYWRSR
jgi:trk system potassium uptake protein TrkH